MNTINDVPKEERVNLSQIHCVVIDNGLFIGIAQVLSKTFKSVSYWCPWTSAFPKSNQWVIGYGIEGVDKLEDLFKFTNSIPKEKRKDYVLVFPDVYSGSMQEMFEDQGFYCFGSRYGEEMELLREVMKEHMEDIGLYTTKYKIVTGTQELRDYIKKHPNVWVKINKTRGDTETFRAEDYDDIEPVLDKLDADIGAVKHIKEFIVEDAYDDAVEVGMDCFCIDGKFPSKSLTGVEIKDLGYIGKFINYDRIPKQITDFNEQVAPLMEEFGYRGFFSTEIRVSKDRPPYMLDFCARAGSPPNELYGLMYKNLADIVYYGAHGYMIDPVVEHKFGVEALLHSSWADSNWQPVTFPAKYADNVRLRNACKIDGKYYCAPQHVKLAEIGAVVAEGDTLEEAIEMCKKVAASVKGHYIECKLDSLETAQAEFQKLRDMGLTII